MYTKLFEKILDSSIWLEPDSTLRLWITLLASMNEDGFCAFACEENLGRRARLKPSLLRRALETLSSPDPRSADSEHEGRRIEKVPGGWMVLNAKKYAALATRMDYLTGTRERVRRHREAENSGTPRNTSEHLGTSQNTSAHLGTSSDLTPLLSTPATNSVTLLDVDRDVYKERDISRASETNVPESQPPTSPAKMEATGVRVEGSDAKLVLIAKLHPKLSHLLETEIPPNTLNTIICAVGTEMRFPGRPPLAEVEALRYVYVETRRVVEAYRSDGREQFIRGPDDFWRKREYRVPSVNINAQQGNGNGQRAEQPSKTDERNRRNREKLLAALHARHPDRGMAGDHVATDAAGGSRGPGAGAVVSLPVVLPAEPG